MTNTLCILNILTTTHPLFLTIYLKLIFFTPLPNASSISLDFVGIREMLNIPAFEFIFFHIMFIEILVESGWKYFCFRCARNVREKERKNK